MDEEKRSCCYHGLTDASALMSWEFPCPLPALAFITVNSFPGYKSSFLPGFQCPPAHCRLRGCSKHSLGVFLHPEQGAGARGRTLLGLHSQPTSLGWWEMPD